MSVLKCFKRKLKKISLQYYCYIGIGNGVVEFKYSGPKNQQVSFFYWQPMDIFLMVKRQKMTIFVDAKKSTTIFELKKMLHDIIKHPPEMMRFYKDDYISLLDDSKTLADCGYTSSTATAYDPAIIGLSLKIGKEFEDLQIGLLSIPKAKEW